MRLRKNLLSTDKRIYKPPVGHSSSTGGRMRLEDIMKKELKMRTTEPKILILDIETSPIVAYTWGPKWETNLIEVLEPSKIICYSAKWLRGKQTTKGLIDYSGYKKNVIDDTKIVKELHSYLDEADIVITQNGRDFDIRTINVRMLANGMKPPSPYKVVDTKIEARKNFKMPSHSLDDMGKYFGLGGKLTHEGFEMWKSCMAGDKKAWGIMKKYNAVDVQKTEKLYLKMLPWMKQHPNLATFKEKESCPKCESSNTQLRGYQINSTTKYQRYQCQDCGGWYRGSKSIKLMRKSGTSI